MPVQAPAQAATQDGIPAQTPDVVPFQSTAATIAPAEIALWGQVVSIDTQSGALKLQAKGFELPSGRRAAFAHFKNKMVRLSPEAALVGKNAAPLQSGSIKPGDWVFVIGPDEGTGSMLRARFLRHEGVAEPLISASALPGKPLLTHPHSVPTPTQSVHAPPRPRLPAPPPTAVQVPIPATSPATRPPSPPNQVTPPSPPPTTVAEPRSTFPIAPPATVPTVPPEALPTVPPPQPRPTTPPAPRPTAPPVPRPTAPPAPPSPELRLPLVPSTARMTAEDVGPWLQCVASIFPNQVKVEPVAVTSAGRRVFAVQITPPGVPLWKLRRLAIICRQHGDEPETTAAGVEFIRRFLTSPTPRAQRLRRQVAILIVPVANPDGAWRKRRHNGVGQDLNRDWGRGRSREVSAMMKLLARWRPHLVVDVHQWVPGDSVQTPMAEAAGGRFGRRVAAGMTLAARGGGYRLVYRTSGSGGSLCHRYWGGRGVPGILLETTHRPKSPRQRQIAIQTSVLALQRALDHVAE